MTDDADRKISKATRILFGVRDDPEPPATVYRHVVQPTPGGTQSRFEPTAEGRHFLNELARVKENAEIARAGIANAPRVPQKAKGHERIIKRDLDKPRDKMHDQDKADDFER
ncbi:MAG: hypothetical protein NVV83_09595 [Afipia sp.]|nr:hypothetical protein [Afipia sp.]